jgi:hypothetical protein
LSFVCLFIYYVFHPTSCMTTCKLNQRISQAGVARLWQCASATALPASFLLRACLYICVLLHRFIASLVGLALFVYSLLFLSVVKPRLGDARSEQGRIGREAGNQKRWRGGEREREGEKGEREGGGECLSSLSSCAYPASSSSPSSSSLLHELVLCEDPDHLRAICHHIVPPSVHHIVLK